MKKSPNDKDNFPDLEKPIKLEVPFAPTLAGKSESDYAIEKAQLAVEHFKESERKISLLIKKYNLDPDAPDVWFRLCRYIAHDYVPGFKVAPLKEAGRFELWDDWLLLLLWIAVERKKEEGKNIPVTKICDLLLKDTFWADRLKEGKGITTEASLASRLGQRKTLQNQYLKASKSTFVKYLNRAADMGLDIKTGDHSFFQQYDTLVEGWLKLHQSKNHPGN